MAEVLAQRALEKPVIPLIPITNSNQYRHAEHDRDYKNKVHTHTHTRAHLSVYLGQCAPPCGQNILCTSTQVLFYTINILFCVLFLLNISIGTVKISVLMQAINFSSLTAYILHGVELGLATPLLPFVFSWQEVHLFSHRMSSQPHKKTGDILDTHSNFTSHFSCTHKYSSACCSLLSIHIKVQIKLGACMSEPRHVQQWQLLK